MSYFDDQEEAWLANDCKGRIEDYDPYDADTWAKGSFLHEPNKDEQAMLKKLEKLADGKGLKIRCYRNGHFQVIAGRKIINWYPFSKRETAYDNVSREKRFFLEPKQVIEFALEKAEATA